MLLAAQAGEAAGAETGLLLIAALAAVAFVVGRVSRRFVSEVIVFIGIGILVGPEALGLIDAAAVAALDPVIALALGAIVFMLGERLELPSLRALRHSLPALALLENVLTFGLVLGGMLAVGVGPGAAYLLAAIALSTSPTTLLAVIAERRAAGELSEHLQAATALNNVTSAVLFGVGLPVVLATSSTSGVSQGVVAFGQLVLASIAIGAVAAWILHQFGPSMRSSGERLMFVLVMVTVTVAVSRWVGAPVVITTLIAGAALANSPHDSRALFASLRSLEAPIFLAFFVVAGTGVHFDELVTIGGTGLVYVVARAAAKLGGGWVGANLSQLGRRANWNQYVGYGLMPFAGMAIGLAAFTVEKASATGLGDLGSLVSAIVLGSVVVFELIGPISVGRALDATGETGQALEEEAEAHATAAVAPHRVERILFPISSPEMARRKAPAVSDLAASAGASLTALRVVTPWMRGDGQGDTTLEIVGRAAEVREVACDTVVVEHDSVIEAILQQAEEVGADLIVIGESDPDRTGASSLDLMHELAERVRPGVQVMVLPTVVAGRRGRGQQLTSS